MLNKWLNTIQCMDCLEGMKEIPSESVNLIITDPPYSIGTTSTGNKGDWLDNNLIKPFFTLWFAEIKRILKINGIFYINTDWRTYPFLYPIAVQYMKVRNCIVWDYEWIKAGSHYRFSHEFIIYGTKDESAKRKFSASERDVWRIPPINFTDTANKMHQAQKPIELIKKMIIDGSDKGDLICDPFMGSGTTARACKDLGRNFIGFEISPKYVEIANKRLQQEVLL